MFFVQVKGAIGCVGTVIQNVIFKAQELYDASA